jgi:hypothetical protein
MSAHGAAMTFRQRPRSRSPSLGAPPSRTLGLSFGNGRNGATCAVPAPKAARPLFSGKTTFAGVSSRDGLAPIATHRPSVSDPRLLRGVFLVKSVSRAADDCRGCRCLPSRLHQTPYPGMGGAALQSAKRRATATAFSMRNVLFRFRCGASRRRARRRMRARFRGPRSPPGSRLERSPPARMP